MAASSNRCYVLDAARPQTKKTIEDNRKTDLRKYLETKLSRTAL